MTSAVTIKRQVEKIKERIMPEHKQDIVVVFSFGPDIEPHGKYGHRKIHIFPEYYVNGQPFEAPSVEEEIRYLREYYDNLEEWNRKEMTFEEFVKQRECKCGRFGHV